MYEAINKLLKKSKNQNFYLFLPNTNFLSLNWLISVVETASNAEVS